MEHNKGLQTDVDNLVACQFCSWRTAERYECTCEEHRIIRPNELPTPLWCPLRVINHAYGKSNHKKL
jgi:hypothetical protein